MSAGLPLSFSNGYDIMTTPCADHRRAADSRHSLPRHPTGGLLEKELFHCGRAWNYRVRDCQRRAEEEFFGESRNVLLQSADPDACCASNVARGSTLRTYTKDVCTST